MTKFLKTIVLTILCTNCYSQDNISKAEEVFPKNLIKVNFLPLLVHTISFSFEREIAKKFSIELEGGYIFPLDKDQYAYHITDFDWSQYPLWASQGYLGRGSLRYYLLRKEHQNFIVFVGASFLFKYRFYNNKKFYDWSYRGTTNEEHYLQSEKNLVYAGEIQGGIRYYPSKHNHLILEASISIGYGEDYRTTDVINHYGKYNQLSPPFVPTRTEQVKPYLSFNPCLKIGYAF